MRMKYLYSVIVLFLSTLSVAQSKSELHPDDTLTIEYIGVKNSAVESIVIGEKLKYVGSRYVAKDTVTWTEDIELIRVMNNRTKKSLELQNPKTPESKKSRFYSAYIKKNMTGTKGSNINDKIQLMKEYLSQEFYMIDDEIYIFSSLIVDSQHTYFLKPRGLSDTRWIRLLFNPDEPYVIYISKRQLLGNNIDVDYEPISFQIIYVVNGKNTFFITEEFTIKSYK